MKAFIINEGTKAIAVKWNGVGQPTLKEVTIKEETLYFIEDIEVDPIGSVGVGPNSKTIGGQWAREGYYGFELPRNKSGWNSILVHGADVIVG